MFQILEIKSTLIVKNMINIKSNWLKSHENRFYEVSWLTINE